MRLMTIATWAAALAIVGCGRLGFDTLDGATDVGVDGAVDVGAAADADIGSFATVRDAERC